jgi:hypothetical protein
MRTTVHGPFGAPAPASPAMPAAERRALLRAAREPGGDLVLPPVTRLRRRRRAPSWIVWTITLAAGLTVATMWAEMTAPPETDPQIEALRAAVQAGVVRR